jgi:hypothetical protein
VEKSENLSSSIFSYGKRTHRSLQSKKLKKTVCMKKIQKRKNPKKRTSEKGKKSNKEKLGGKSEDLFSMAFSFKRSHKTSGSDDAHYMLLWLFH